MKRKATTGLSREQVKMRFREAAKSCSAQVKHLPKGQRRQAYLDCIRSYLRGR